MTERAISRREFFPVNRAQSCGAGFVGGEAATSHLDGRIKASLAMMCAGTVSGITSSDTCDQPDGQITIAFSQLFGFHSNIIKIQRPCP